MIKAIGVLDRLEPTFHLMFPDPEREYHNFRRRHRELKISGKQVHDIRIVAACQALEVDKLLTLNLRHFDEASSLGHVELITPETVG